MQRDIEGIGQVWLSQTKDKHTEHLIGSLGKREICDGDFLEVRQIAMRFQVINDTEKRFSDISSRITTRETENKSVIFGQSHLEIESKDEFWEHSDIIVTLLKDECVVGAG
ncbi:MAG: hypothetical protein EOO43_24070 [Flavobacterium sp.]|nr:MAG: hypothetical protein EOO43_24070 [Flavobacterium sp.]